jgi:regulator of protease activity HflC (stomatin/prohibitin superfamily)
LKEVFGNMTFSQALRSQSEINEHLVAEFGKLFAGWGIHVERMELLDLMPKENTQAVMKKQMIAERTRRGEFIRSEACFSSC